MNLITQHEIIEGGVSVPLYHKHLMEQGSFEWHEMRNDKLTGTGFKNIMGTDMLSVADRLIANSETGYMEDDSYVSEEMQRGTDLEPKAIEAYETRTGWRSERVGFIQSVKYPLFGYSPDGLIGGDGEIEVKCPSTHRHVKYIRQNQVPNDYKWQIIAKFVLRDDLQWVDFVSFDPRFTKKPLFVYRQMRSDVTVEIAEGQVKVEKFFAKPHQLRNEILF